MNQFKHTPEQARKLWVEALRSGRFKQGQEYLEVDGCNCCLGVACRVLLDIEGPLLELDSYEDDDVDELEEEARVIIRFDGRTDYASPVVREWLGLETENGEYKSGDLLKTDMETSLANDNDNYKTFDEIADIIESNPPGLFV